MESSAASARDRLAAAKLYFVCEARPGGTDAPVAQALRGGADLVQLREPRPSSDEELLAAARAFQAAARAAGRLFILNDRPDLVHRCDADGVHVGQDDPPVAEARRLAGETTIVGLSSHSPAQLDAACEARGADRPDYLSVGPVWETPTKRGRAAAGLEYVRYAAAHATLPWFAIGGIDGGNIGEVLSAGAERVVVVRAIRDAPDPEAAASQLKAALGSKVKV